MKNFLVLTLLMLAVSCNKDNQKSASETSNDLLQPEETNFEITENISTDEVEHCINILENGLNTKSIDLLKSVAHPALSMVHSNGLNQDFNELLESVEQESIVYETIKKLSDVQVLHRFSNYAVSRRDVNVKGKLDTTAFDIDLHVLELWVKENDTVKLIARQSLKRLEDED
ncbi:MAG: nuclear transport factor 2 family protein [Flavobacteriaceae bacterium]|nr:nuclear transport factor 2 family protein [Flavobacteriaceae bacterium]